MKWTTSWLFSTEYFGQPLKAAQCAHMLQAACLFGPPLSNPSIAIHPLPPCLCLSVSGTVHVLAGGQRRLVGDLDYENIDYESS